MLERDAHGHAPASPRPVERLVAAGQRGAAMTAAAVRGDLEAQDLVPVANDERPRASGTERGSTFPVVHVAGVDVVEAATQRDRARPRERGRRRPRQVGHLVVGMEGGEMQRHVGPELARDPAALGLDLGVAVVLARDEQRRDLGPHVGLVHQIDERVEDRLQVRTAQLHVELVGEAFEIDVGRVHLRVELAPRIDADVTGSHGDRRDPAGVARIRGIHRVLGEDDRIVVRERDAAAAARMRGGGNGGGRRRVLQRVHLARLRNVPVLAELAGEVAAGGPERQHRRAGIEMIERFLFDRVDAESGRASVRRQHHRIVLALAHEAGAALPFVQPAVARTQVALDASVGQRMPPAAGIVVHRATFSWTIAPVRCTC